MRNLWLFFLSLFIATRGQQPVREHQITERKPAKTRTPKVYSPLNKKSRLRKEKHWMKCYNLKLRGLIWYDNKVYWETRALAEANR